MEKNMLVGFIASRTRKPMFVLNTTSGVRFPAVVDTGFNGQLLMDMWTGHGLNVEMTGEYIPVTLAGGIQGEAQIGGLSIEWFGLSRFLQVTVLQIRPQYPYLAPAHLSESEVLIGTALMHPGRLTVDFLEETVRLNR